MLLSTVGSGIEALWIWGFSRSLWSLAIFVLLYENTAGGFAVLRPRFATAIAGHDKDKKQSLLAARGFSIVASRSIASTQIDESLKVTSSYYAGK